MDDDELSNNIDEVDNYNGKEDSDINSRISGVKEKRYMDSEFDLGYKK